MSSVAKMNVSVEGDLKALPVKFQNAHIITNIYDKSLHENNIYV